MKISLRPHHFLCLQGYKGLNYSKSGTIFWNRVSDLLNKSPNTDILIINKSDDLCSKCPAQNSKSARCIETKVNNIDKKVTEMLGLIVGKTYKYNEVVEKLQQKMTKEKHEELCRECAWWKHGQCKDSFKASIKK